MIKVERKLCGLKMVHLITVTNETGLTLVLEDVGAGIYKCILNGKKITYGPEKISEFIKSPDFYGKTVGRTAGRIRDGKINVDGKEIQLAHGEVQSLHGGYGFSFRKYDYKKKETDDEIIVTFKYVSRDREKGYPGDLINNIVYRIKKKTNTFTIDFKAIANQNTICNLTNHTYWNLNGDDSKITNHQVFIDADEYVEIDDKLLKVSINPVDDVFDFRKIKKLGDFIENERIQKVALGYDHDWILNKRSDDKPNAIFINDDQSLTLNVYTSNPVCHLYTGNYFPEGKKYGAVAIEMQKRIFDVDEGKVDLKKGVTYREFTRYEFITK